MFFKFLPKDFNFFELLDKQTEYAKLAAATFKEIAIKGEVSEQDLAKMQDIEHQGDEVAHQILEQLDKTFITPIDREDIHKLAAEMDNISDMLCTIVSRMKIYKIRKMDKSLVKFASIIEDSVKAVSCAVHDMRDMKNAKSIFKSCVEINSLENKGDALRDEMLVDLFDNEKDPIALIKWKEIYQDAETVLDVCEDIANIVESIVVKQA